MAGHDDMLTEHQKTWNSFVKLMFWISSGILFVLALMGIFLL